MLCLFYIHGPFVNEHCLFFEILNDIPLKTLLSYSGLFFNNLQSSSFLSRVR